MEADTLADTRFGEVLEIEGISITDNKAYYPSPQIFSEGTEFPEFFNDNEAQTNRTIKQLTSDPHSNLRIIYLEVFRLALEDDDDTYLTNLKRKVFSVDFEITFTAETDDKRQIFNDFQFKRFFAEFILIAQQLRNEGIESILQRFPLMDQVFIHILRTILAQQVKEDFNTRIPTQTVFSFLGKQLGLDIVSYVNSWKFEDADMVCYEGPEQELYAVYTIDETSHIPSQVVYLSEPLYYDQPVGGQINYTSQVKEGAIQSQSSHTYESSTIHTGVDNLASKYAVDPISEPISYTNYQSNLGDFSSKSYDIKYDTSYSPEPYKSSYNTYTDYQSSSYTKSYQPTTNYSNYTNAAETYKLDDKVNALVDKYLNTNPEDIIGSTTTSYDKVGTNYEKYTTTSYQPSSSSSYLSSFKYEEPAADYKYSTNYSSTTYTPYNAESSYTTKYESYGNYDNLTGLVGNLNLGSTTEYSSQYSSSLTDYSTSSYATTDYNTGYSNSTYKS